MGPEEWHIVFAEPYGPDSIARARQAGSVTLLDNCNEDTLIRALSDADALLMRTYARITRRILNHATRLKVIGRGGVGLENIDLEAARERGITVVHTPAAGTDAVADLTVGLILSLLRGIHRCDSAVRAGKFHDARNAPLGLDLRTLSLGIVGMGRIGRAVATRCALGFEMPVLYNDIIDVGPFPFDARPVSKDELYAQSDIISLHVPLTDQTRKLINKTALAKLKRDAILINTARGAVVDSDALVAALTGNRLAGAALDVTDPEPLPEDHPLLSLPNTLFTSHIGARTRQAQERMDAVVDDVIRVLRGEQPHDTTGWIRP
jgi:D-3-phosphoglycerate dehydrogenase / 2-oxoglutarate reductase